MGAGADACEKAGGTVPALPTTRNGAQPSANAALLSLGGEMAWKNGWSVLAKFDSELSRNGQVFAGNGALRYAW